MANTACMDLEAALIAGVVVAVDSSDVALADDSSQLAPGVVVVVRVA